MKLLALTVATASLTSVLHAQVLEQTSFESGQGFTLGSIDGQNGWNDFLGFDVISGNAFNGTQCVSASTSDLSAGWAYKVFGTSPNYINSGVLATRCFIKYNDPTPATRDDNSAFGLEAWADDGLNRFATIMLDARGGATIKGGQNDPATYVASIPAPSDVYHEVLLVVDITAKQAAGYVNGNLVGTVTNTTVPALTNVSDVDLAYYAFDLYSDNFGVTLTGGFNTGFWDSYLSERVPNGVLQGKVDLQDYTASPAGVPVTIEIIDPTSGNTLDTLTDQLDADGYFRVTTTRRGSFRIGVKPPHWLRKVSNPVTIANIGVWGLNVSAINGDVDGDNEVGPGDFGLLATAFLSVDGDPNWNANADLDGDGEVGPGDFGILATNFLTSGD